MPKTVDTRRHYKVGLRACNNLPQPPPYIFGFGGLQKIVSCSQPYLAVPSCVYSFWHSVINIDPYILFLIFTLIRESVDSLCRDGADTPMPPYIGKAFTRTNFEDLSLFRYMIMVCE